jgi:hypothetical protein
MAQVYKGDTTMDLPMALVAGQGNITVDVPVASPGGDAVVSVDSVDVAHRPAAALHRPCCTLCCLCGWCSRAGPSWLLLLLAVPAAGYCGAAGHRWWLLCAYAAACIAMVVERMVLFLALSVEHGTALLLGGLLELAVPSVVAGYMGAELSTEDLRLLRAGWRPPPQASPCGSE